MRASHGNVWVGLGGGTQHGAHVPQAEGFLLGRLGLITGEGIGT